MIFAYSIKVRVSTLADQPAGSRITKCNAINTTERSAVATECNAYNFCQPSKSKHRTSRLHDLLTSSLLVLDIVLLSRVVR